MNGDDFIPIAGKLAALSDADEACFRTSVSRAYYGAFHLGRSFLEDLGITPPKNANVHAFVWQMLMGSDQPDAVAAGSLLRNLQTNRNRADYQLDDGRWGTVEFARSNVERSHEIRSALSACMAEPVRSEVAAAIEEYRERIADRR